MHHLLAADNGESSRSRSRQRARTEVSEHRSMWERLSLQKKIGSWLKREDEEEPALPRQEKAAKTAEDEEQNADGDNRDGDRRKQDEARPHSSGEHTWRASTLLNRRRSNRRVVPGLPRPLTFKRMQSEKRDKLVEVPVEGEQRRAASVDRTEATPAKRSLSPPPVSLLSLSAPNVLSLTDEGHAQQQQLQQQPPRPDSTIGGQADSNIPAGSRQVDYGIEELPILPAAIASEPPAVDMAEAVSQHGSAHSHAHSDDMQLQEELEAKWILNLSMHFRDLSDREKFFVTYAEEPNKWRRVTVSCDYRRLEPDSLEADLKSLHYQRDKSLRIYEAIRDSLADIQFYDTVTNLKLETADGRLHVHVTEDVNEIIPYPSLSAIEHLQCRRFKESAIAFDSHISGFVYKVSADHKTFIKKEIPGPDAVEEFLYEINALCSLQDANFVIRFEGIIVDEHNELIKGLLISYAEQGALVDMIYDYKPTGQLNWQRRERWARQIVEGLSEIHEAGFVQGDFTLSNIVIDHNDDAKIIDINRRGCPVGWEPPELARLIESGQRISIYIGVKSDLYQLGMVLWALAEQQDEPERQDRPLAKTLDRHNTDVPVYFRDIIRACLHDSPRSRPSAANLLKRFPDLVAELSLRTKPAARESVSSHRSDKEYIDPATAVDLEDISRHRRHSRQHSSFEKITVPPTEYPASSGSYIIPCNDADRGRSCNSDNRKRTSDCSPYPGHRSVMSLDDSEIENELASLPASRETRWEQVYIDGDTKLVQRACADMDVHDFAAQEPKDVRITSPPNEVESSFLGSNETNDGAAPLSLSMLAALQPVEPQSMQNSLQEPLERGHHRGVGSKASFSDRVHQLAQSQTQHADGIDVPFHQNRHSVPDPTILTNLEHDIAMDSSVTSTNPPSRVSTSFSIFEIPDRTRRVGTGFSIAQGHHRPLHQDSGFAEPERVSYESERIRHSLDESIRDLRKAQEEEDRVNAQLWDEREGPVFGKGVCGPQLEIDPASVPVFQTIPASPPRPMEETTTSAKSLPPTTVFGSRNVLRVEDVQGKALEEKSSNTTIRPPNIPIPDYHHGLPKGLDSSRSYLATTTTATFQTGAITPMSSTQEQQHPYYDDDPFVDDEQSRASDDLTDYLSHSISYSHHSDLQAHGHHYHQEQAGSHHAKT